MAQWYDRLVGDEGSDYHKNVVLPAVLRLLAPQPGQRVLDLCCGQGVLCRLLAAHRLLEVVGVDASPELIASAKQRGSGPGVRYVVGDARNLGPLAAADFDAAACVLALHDLDPVEPVIAQLGAALRPGGRAVVVLMHPCFRIPRQSSWGWDEEKKTQYRRLDRYVSPLAVPITANPGRGATLHTTFFHRPLATYLNACGAARLGVVACEELLTHRQTQPGSRSRGENRSRKEFPIFLALAAVKHQH